MAFRFSPGKSGEQMMSDLGLEAVRVENVSVNAATRLVAYTDPRSPGAERFRFLRMRLSEHWRTDKLKTLVITSPLPGDGKSTTALNLATTLAEHGRRKVLLMEADLHRPTITQGLG